MNQLSGRYLEDFAVGQTFGSGRLRIDKERIFAFAAEFDPQPFHLDEAAAHHSIFGGLCASGWHTLAVSGGHPRATAPLVLGNEGAGVIEDAGDSGLAVGSRVMFTGPYGVREDGAWQEWLLARAEDLAFVPDTIDDVVAASLPVAYLTAQITLTLAGFKPGMTVLAPGIGGSVGNATY
jgi:D-arabinose 1-dehydrogenase-like Zn-dependent alcohol dehydrogenase